MNRHHNILTDTMQSDISADLRAYEIQATARRQFSLSIVVAAAVAIVALPAAMAPHRQQAVSSAQHQFALIRTPTFVTPKPQRPSAPERLAALSEDLRPASTEASARR
jgi:hypothetical protein